MTDFIINAILWTLALYGLTEIIKNIYYISTYTNLKSDGIYLIVAVKNQANRIEGFVRTILFRILYGKEDNVNKILITDLGSTDETKKILEGISKDYEFIDVINWRECKEVIDSINKN
jgi:hypothetical protein